MANRKNPLKDLDAFLKQEATSIVKPGKATTAEPAKEATPPPRALSLATPDQIIQAIEQLASHNEETYRHDLYKIIKSSLETLDHTSPEDKMLINTILYLTDKNNWKSNIKAYWEQHS